MTSFIWESFKPNKGGWVQHTFQSLIPQNPNRLYSQISKFGPKLRQMRAVSIGLMMLDLARIKD